MTQKLNIQLFLPLQRLHLQTANVGLNILVTYTTNYIQCPIILIIMCIIYNMYMYRQNLLVHNDCTMLIHAMYVVTC